MTKTYKGWAHRVSPEKYLKQWPRGKEAEHARALLAAEKEQMKEVVAQNTPEPEPVEPEPEAPVEENKMMKKAVVADDEAELLKRESHDLVAQAKALTIKSTEEYEQAAFFLQGCKELRQKIEEHHRPNIQRWHEGHKSAVADLKRDSEPVELATGIVKAAVKTYLEIQAEKRRQYELEQAARAAEAEKARQAALAAPAVDPWEEAEEVEENRVDITHTSGEPWAVTPPPPPLPTGLGITQAKRWAFELLDIGKATRTVLTWDEKKIRQLVNSLGQDAEEIVGKGAIRIFQDTTIGVR